MDVAKKQAQLAELLSDFADIETIRDHTATAALLLALDHSELLKPQIETLYTLHQMCIVLISRSKNRRI